MLRPFLTALAPCVALFLGGCATGSQPSAMVGALESPVQRPLGTVQVTVTGGSETISLGASKIADEDFAAAIRTSLLSSNVFSEVTTGEEADYTLKVEIVRLDQPAYGTTAAATLEATWSLLPKGSRKPVWQKVFVTSASASPQEAFSSVTRLRIANEGAARRNIREALTELAAIPSGNLAGLVFSRVL